MSSCGYGQTSSTLWGPTLMRTLETSNRDVGHLEVSVHTLPRPLQREFQHVFDERHLNLDAILQRHEQENQQQQQQQQQAEQSLEELEFLAIPTNQQAKEDLVAVGESVEAEKDRLLNVFIQFARFICEQIRAQGFWADFIDPCSGLPMLTLNCNKVYSEVDGMECCLGYKSYNAGFCKILTHPVWGSAVYPATMFAYAPRSVVIRILESYPRPAQ